MAHGRRFHLQERIGAGAYGEVFLAEQDSGAGFRKRVAIKLLHTRLEGTADAGRRFRDEARILGRLSHRHIVTVLDLVQLEERWAVIMDFVPGADLEHVIEALEHQQTRFPVPAALEAASAICAALDAAYHAPDGGEGTLGVVHRDIKPSNVRLTTDGEIKVLDFGVASVNMETREAETGHHRMGTERYMAPERILGEDSGTAGDIYAVAATLAELLLGEPLGRTPVLPDRHAPFVDEAIARLEARLDPEQADQNVAILDGLRAALSGTASDRPTAAEWGETLAEAARTYPGERLTPFARRFVKEVGVILGHQAETVSGILSEGTLPAGRSNVVHPDPQDFAGHPPTLSPGSTGVPPRAATGLALMIGLAAGVGALALVALIAISMGALSRTPAAEELSEPVVVEEPAPEPEPEPEPVEVEPIPVEVAPVPEAVEVPAEPAPAPQPKPRPRPKPKPAARGAEVDRAMFVVPDASSVTVNCGGVTGSGSQAVRLRRFTGGSCSVNATYLGQALSGTATVNSVREVRCTPSEEALTCD
ncbi:MAG: serine/threonine protein kinase [Proteobacteria bacterium]|nr:serine/threonine protein kinase [Pseudomonadota bacterium]